MNESLHWNGASWQDISASPPEVVVLDSRTYLAKRIAIIAGVISLVFSLLGTVSFAGSSSDSLADLLNSTSSASTDTASTQDISWVPTGYSVWTTDSNIAWRWASSNSYTCSSDGGCIAAEFISQNGCSSGLYAAINWLDSPAGQAGSVISYANSTLPSLRPLQKAKLIFNDIEGTGKSGQMAEINCY